MLTQEDRQRRRALAMEQGDPQHHAGFRRLIGDSNTRSSFRDSKSLSDSLSKMLSGLQRTTLAQGRRALSTEPFLPRITDRRLNEQGAGGRQSNSGLRFAIFGATGFLGKHVCNQLGKKDHLK